jgi:hypothetical protein
MVLPGFRDAALLAGLASGALPAALFLKILARMALVRLAERPA